MRLWNEKQLEAIAEATARARGGQTTLLIIEGEAGTGKTALLNEVASRAPDFQTLSAEGLENEQGEFTVLAELGVDPARTPDDAAAAPLVAAQALLAKVDMLARSGPLLVRLDDLHWADPESVEVLVWLLRRVPTGCLLVVVASRPLQPPEHSAWQRWAASNENKIKITLTGLSISDATILAERRRPEITAETVRRLWEHTGGNPLYLNALLDEHEPIELEAAIMLPAPAEYARLLNAKVARLPPDSTSLLRATAVLGAGWTPLFDAAVVGQVDDSINALPDLLEAGLVELRTLEGPPMLRTSHALTRAAIYQQTPLRERRALHTRAAKVVTAQAASLQHRASAAAQYDEGLATELTVFAQRFYSQRSFRQAAQFLRWASGLTADSTLRQRRWLDALFYRVIAGELAAVHRETDDVRRADQTERGALVLGALAVWEQRRRDAIELFSPVAEQPLESTDPLTRYRVEVLLAWARIGAGLPPQAIAEGLSRARRLRVEDTALSATELVAAGQMSLRLNGATAAINELRNLPDSSVDVPLGQTHQLAWRGTLRGREGLLSQAIADLSETTKRIHHGVTDFGSGSFHGFLGYAQWFHGDWNRARLNLNLAADISGHPTHPMVLAVAPLPDIGEGRFADADAALGRAEAGLLQSPWWEACGLVAIIQVIRLHAGGTTAEQTELIGKWRGTVWDISGPSRSALLVLHQAIAAAWANDLEAAERCVEELTSREPHASWIPAASEWLRGLMYHAAGDDAQAFSHMTTAITLDAGELPLYRAHMLFDHARLARVWQDPIEEDSSARAEHIYRQLGAKPYLERLALFRHAGQQVDETTPIAMMTERERDVLTLMLSGMTYAQISRELFITQSTVSFHLGHIYTKLGVGSRHQLTELARRNPNGFRISIRPD